MKYLVPPIVIPVLLVIGIAASPRSAGETDPFRERDWQLGQEAALLPWREGDSNRRSPWVAELRFAADSPLEGRVRSEPVSEIRSIPGDSGRNKLVFGAENHEESQPWLVIALAGDCL
jgi:hypothetical protein